MKRQKKRLLGFFGLLLVAIMTVVAAATPGPETSALSTITDTIQVRVIGSVPDVKFKYPNQNIVTASSQHVLLITHENVDSARIKLGYKHEDGSIDEYNIASYDNLDYEASEKSADVDFRNYGYGEFILSLYGVGYEGSELEFDGVLIEYVPIIAGPVIQNDDGKVTTIIQDYSDDVETVEIYIDGKLVKVVEKDELDDEITLPMDGYDSGTYNVFFVAKNSSDEQIYTPTRKPLDFEEDIYVPDTSYTGQFFHGLNISKEDYLVTGLLIFFIFGIVAFGIVLRSNKKTKSRKKKH